MRRVSALLLAVALAATGVVVWLPRAAAAAGPYGVNIVSTNSYVDIIDYVHVIGEVVNDTRFPVRFVRVNVDFYDAADVLVGTAFSFTDLDVLDPGERSGFDVFDDVVGAETYEVRVTYQTATTPANHYFRVEATSESTDEFGRTEIVGTVTNLNTTAADFVAVYGTFYNELDEVVGVEFDFANSDSTSMLRAGETASFEIVFYDTVYARYELVAESNTAPSLPVTIAASPTAPVYGSLVRVSGSAAPGAAVTIQRWDLAKGWVTLASTTANAGGRYAVDAKITTTWFIRALTDAGPSVPRTYLQKALVSLTSNATTVKKNVYVTLSGLVRPTYPGKKVTIQQLVSGAWKNVATVTLSSSSSYSYRWRSSRAGTFTFRTLVATQADSTTNVSASRRIVVR